MDIKRIVLVVVCAPALAIADTSQVFNVTSAYLMPLVIRDLVPHDAVSALIAAFDADVRDMKLGQSGVYRFNRKLGPFDNVEVIARKQSEKNPFLDQHFSYGGQISRVVSTSECYVASFDDANNQLRMVVEKLLKEMPGLELEETSSSNKSLKIQNVRPLAGGWDIELKLDMLGMERCLFKLDMSRSLRQSRKNQESYTIPIDVDI